MKLTISSYNTAELSLPDDEVSCKNSEQRKPQKRYQTLFLCFLFILVYVLLNTKDVYAHNPHDIITTLELSPSYDQDKTLFVYNGAEGLQKSSDGGNTWKILTKGLDNKGPISSIVISPSFHSDQSIFAAGVGPGVYRSQDGGDSWVKVNKGLDNLSIKLLSISTNYDSDRILLAADSHGGLHKTNNGGDSWYRILDNSTPITSVTFWADQHKKAVLLGDRSGSLYLSTDGGEHWHKRFTIPNAGAITSVAIPPNFSVDGTMFVGTKKNGVYKTVDSGTSVLRINNGLLDYSPISNEQSNTNSKQIPIFIRSLVLSPEYETDATIFACTWYQAVFKSNDGGNSWKLYKQGVTTDKQADNANYSQPHFNDLRVPQTFNQDKTIFLAGFAGLFKSTDDGHTWVELETSPPGNITQLGISSNNNSVIAVTTSGGGLNTTDKQWKSWAINSRGLNRIDLMDVAFSPNYRFDDTIFLVSEQDFAISTDKGNSFSTTKARHSDSWLRRGMRSALRKLNLPIPDSLKYPRILHDWIVMSPNFTFDKTIYLGNRYGGIYRSIDGGNIWSALWQGHETASLTISPDFATDRTLFVVSRSDGVYKTLDGGDSWNPKNNGLKIFTNVQRSSAARGDTKLAISSNYKEDQTVFLGTPTGLFMTTDSGNNWKILDILATVSEEIIIGLAISPDYKIDKTIIVSIKGKGLFISMNGGLTFAEIGTDLINNNHSLMRLEFSTAYADDQTIYGASREEVFQSTNGGHNWQKLPRPTRYEDKREMIKYEGQWHRIEEDNFSTSSIIHSDVAYDRAVFNFVGTGITWIGTHSNDQGIANVYIDGEHIGEIDQFSRITRSMVTSYVITDLDYGLHTITVEVTNKKNPSSVGHRVSIDAFDVAPRM